MASSGGDGGVAMDSSGGDGGGDDEWSRIPEEVIAQRIASKLSAYDVMRLSFTCLRFKSLLQSSVPCFASKPNLLILPADDPSMPSEDPHRLDSALSFDPHSHRWFHLSLSFLRHHLPPFSHPIASSSGLICFGSSKSYLLCNPITKSFQKLPDIPPSLPSPSSRVADDHLRIRLDEDCVQAFGLRYDHLLHGYDLVTIMASTGYGVFCKAVVYSSRLCRWVGISELRMSKPAVLKCGSIEICKEGFYSLWQRPLEYVIYRVDGEGNWEEIEAPDCSSPLLSAHLMTHNGLLHLIAGVGMVWLNVNVVEYPMSIRIWQLHHVNKHWSEIGRLPSALLHEFHDRVHFHTLHCWSSQGIIYMTSASKEILMFDSNSGNWEWLENFNVEGDLTGHILEPSLVSADTALPLTS